MSQVQQVKPVELVLPPHVGPTPEVPPMTEAGWSSTTWIVLVAAVVLTANAVLVWWRIRHRDPLQQAFKAASRKLGLTRRERQRVVQVAPEGCPPVSLLISESVLDEAASGEDDPLIVSVRAKLDRVRM